VAWCAACTEAPKENSNSIDCHLLIVDKVVEAISHIVHNEEEVDDLASNDSRSLREPGVWAFVTLMMTLNIMNMKSYLWNNCPLTLMKPGETLGPELSEIDTMFF